LRRFGRGLTVAAFVLYALVVILMFSLQTHFIFPTHAVGPAGPLPKGAERLKIGTDDGETLHGVHIPPSHGNGNGTLLLSFAGNAWNSQEAANYIHQLYPKLDVVGFHYRGYRPSTGEPSAKALLKDAPAIYDFAVERLKPKRIVAVGFSIGSGVAAALAAKRKLDGLILVTPFDSLEAVAGDQYAWLPISTLFKHEIDSAAALRKVDAPVAIIAAELDALIRRDRTDGLRKAVRNLSYDRTIRAVGHNDIYQRSAFQDAMAEAMAALSR
jgi:pimeloyl-ACP methyl ester carboxylesterase